MRFPHLFAMIIPVALGCGSGFQQGTSNALVGQNLPDVKKETLDGVKLDTSNLRGRPVVVKFFSETCAPCKTTLPAAQKAHAKYPEVVFIGVSEDDKPETAREVAKTHGVTFQVVHDGGQSLAGRFRVPMVPSFYVVDRRGVVRWVGTDKTTDADLDSAISAALASAP